jgi:hypothetical protein
MEAQRTDNPPQQIIRAHVLDHFPSICLPRDIMIDLFIRPDSLSFGPLPSSIQFLFDHRRVSSLLPWSASSMNGRNGTEL